MSKFCKDCKHATGASDRLKCNSPKNSYETYDTARFLVTGEEQEKVNAMLGASCMALRGSEVHPTLGMQLCGFAGNWFEEK